MQLDLQLNMFQSLIFVFLLGIEFHPKDIHWPCSMLLDGLDHINDQLLWLHHHKHLQALQASR
jgi:hypothetical protein